MELSERKKQILKAVVDAYIEKCEPVGSKYLVDFYNLDLSPATIRNTMNELEQLGFLEQPYTSAGRIPSSLGYRVYVDSLMQNYRLTSREIKEIDENLNIKISRLDKIIEQSGKLVSALTSLMSVSMTPKSSSVSLVRIDLVYFDFNNFLLVILTSVNIVKTKHIYSKTEIGPDVLDHLKKVLNNNLADRDINTVSLPLILSMENMMGDYFGIISPILKVIYEAISEINEAQIYIDGAANLFKMPEYHDIEKAKSLVSLIENKEQLLQIFSQSVENRLNIYIGDENSITSGGDSSFIFKTFSIGDKILGAIGVIGPKRMDYSRVIAKLEYFSINMADIIKNEIEEKSNSYTAIDDTKFMQGGNKNDNNE
ncbi:MAG: heat-inducible transcriptional repressor HrcA [Oscillospiraceae bacterium]|nr:heat-inducible transcriptional repressor HrcA [Oscillospiraceae bacterium]